MERDLNSSVRESSQLRGANDRLKAEKNSLEQELFETQQSLTELQNEFQRLQDSTKRDQEQVEQERRMNEHLVEELSKEVMGPLKNDVIQKWERVRQYLHPQQYEIILI